MIITYKVKQRISIFMQQKTLTYVTYTNFDAMFIGKLFA